MDDTDYMMIMSFHIWCFPLEPVYMTAAEDKLKCLKWLFYFLINVCKVYGEIASLPFHTKEERGRQNVFSSE